MKFLTAFCLVMLLAGTQADWYYSDNCDFGEVNSNYYLSSGNGCEPCPLNCATCLYYTSKTKLTCVACDWGYYLDSTGVCSPCTSGCDECSGPELKDCSLVAVGSWYDRDLEEIVDSPVVNCAITNEDGTCQLCESDYVCNEKNRACDSCDLCAIENCYDYCVYDKESDDPSNHYCLICESGYYSKDGVCVENPDLNCMFYDADEKECLFCQEGYFTNEKGECNECKKSNCAMCVAEDQCGFCDDGYGFDSNLSIDKLDNLDSEDCASCDIENCKYCLTTAICYECASGYELDEKGECQECSEKNCYKCNVFGLGCDLCDEGYYSNTLSECDECDISNCAKCEDGRSSSQCEYCEAGYELKGNSCKKIDFGDFDNCLIEGEESCLLCESGHYYDDESDACLACNSQCLECSGPGDYECTVCSIQDWVYESTDLPSCDSDDADCIAILLELYFQYGSYYSDWNLDGYDLADYDLSNYYYYVYYDYDYDYSDYYYYYYDLSDYYLSDYYLSDYYLSDYYLCGYSDYSDCDYEYDDDDDDYSLDFDLGDFLSMDAEDFMYDLIGDLVDYYVSYYYAFDFAEPKGYVSIYCVSKCPSENESGKSVIKYEKGGRGWCSSYDYNNEASVWSGANGMGGSDHDEGLAMISGMHSSLRGNRLSGFIQVISIALLGLLFMFNL